MGGQNGVFGGVRYGDRGGVGRGRVPDSGVDPDLVGCIVVLVVLGWVLVVVVCCYWWVWRWCLLRWC